MLNVNVNLKNGFVLFCFRVVQQESVDLGEVMFSLCYLPTAGRLTLTVIKCRNLKAMDITGYSGVCLCVCVIHLQLQWLRVNDPRVNVQL